MHSVHATTIQEKSGNLSSTINWRVWEADLEIFNVGGEKFDQKNWKMKLRQQQGKVWISPVEMLFLTLLSCYKFQIKLAENRTEKMLTFPVWSDITCAWLEFCSMFLKPWEQWTSIQIRGGLRWLLQVCVPSGRDGENTKGLNWRTLWTCCHRMQISSTKSCLKHVGFKINSPALFCSLTVQNIDFSKLKLNMKDNKCHKFHWNLSTSVTPRKNETLCTVQTRHMKTSTHSDRAETTLPYCGKANLTWVSCVECCYIATVCGSYLALINPEK